MVMVKRKNWFLGREISEQRDCSEAVAEKLIQKFKARECCICAGQKIWPSIVLNLWLLITRRETLSREEFEKMFPPPVKKTGGTPKLRSVK
jgi:cell division protease FtsH